MVPSSFGYTWSARLACCRRASSFSALRSMRRQPRTMRSTCSAVPARPMASSLSSVSGVATRVRARTLAYESSPRRAPGRAAAAWRGRGPREPSRGPRPGRGRRARRATRHRTESRCSSLHGHRSPGSDRAGVRRRRRGAPESSAIASPMRSLGRRSTGGVKIHRESPLAEGIYTSVSKPSLRLARPRLQAGARFFDRTVDRRFRPRLASPEGRLSQRLIRWTARPLNLSKSRLSDTHAK